MKKFLQKIVFSVVVIIATAGSVYAQVPQGFNFQAVARGASGDILAEQDLGVKVSIIKGTETGNPVYTETHSVTTNPLGLIQLVIGEGTPADGETFAGVDFGNDNYYVKLAIDVSGGTEYEDLGTTRLLSVPYALVAQKSIEGGSSGGATEFNLNTDEGDTTFSVKATGTKGLTSIRGTAETEGQNTGIAGVAVSEASNQNNMFGVYGSAGGEGTGNHLGVFGSAVNPEATGGSRHGVWGQARSKAKYNYGTYGFAGGDGNGDAGQGFGVGSINFGAFGYATGNTWNNTGMEGQAGGEGGAENYGVHGLSYAGTGESVKNHGLAGRASGSGINYGVYGAAWDGVENYAGFFDGDVTINGNLQVNGSVSGGSGGDANGATLDSLFISTPPDAGTVRSTAFYPGFMRLEDSNGNFSTLSRLGLQYGDSETEGLGNVYNWYSKGGMQVTKPDYANGERSAGMAGGYLYMDILQNDSFYVPFEMGIENATEGGKSWFRMSSLTRRVNDLGALYEITISNDPNGNDPSGESSQIMMHGDTSPNFQFGGQSWENNDLAFLNMYGSTSNGDGWFHSNVEVGVASDGTDEWGAISLKKTNISGNTSQETILIDGGSGNINISGTLTQSSDKRLKKDIRTIENALEKTTKMRGVSYTWKTDMTNQDPQIGVVAQELEEIYPEFVQTDDNGMKSVNYAQMTAVLIEAVKELNTEVQELKSANTTLQAKLDTQAKLETRLAKIEELLNMRSSVQLNPINSTKE